MKMLVPYFKNELVIST